MKNIITFSILLGLSIVTPLPLHLQLYLNVTLCYVVNSTYQTEMSLVVYIQTTHCSMSSNIFQHTPYHKIWQIHSILCRLFKNNKYLWYRVHSWYISHIRQKLVECSILTANVKFSHFCWFCTMYLRWTGSSKFYKDKRGNDFFKRPKTSCLLDTRVPVREVREVGFEPSVEGLPVETERTGSSIRTRNLEVKKDPRRTL